MKKNRLTVTVQACHSVEVCCSPLKADASSVTYQRAEQLRLTNRKQSKFAYIILIVLSTLFQLPKQLWAQATQSTSNQSTNNVLYLPVASTWRSVSVERTERADFVVDSLRLWHVIENGGSMANGTGASFNCGTQRKVQIHVFDTQGDVGLKSRLSGIIIHVLHADGRTQREELKATGMARYGVGMVEFDLQSWAEVKVLTNTNGRLVVSDVAKISTYPLSISTNMLQQSGYCSNEEECRRFASANTCIGNFSWNIVFKKQVK